MLKKLLGVGIICASLLVSGVIFDQQAQTVSAYSYIDDPMPGGMCGCGSCNCLIANTSPAIKEIATAEDTSFFSFLSTKQIAAINLVAGAASAGASAASSGASAASSGATKTTTSAASSGAAKTTTSAASSGTTKTTTSASSGSSAASSGATKTTSSGSSAASTCLSCDSSSSGSSGASKSSSSASSASTQSMGSSGGSSSSGSSASNPNTSKPSAASAGATAASSGASAGSSGSSKSSAASSGSSAASSGASSGSKTNPSSQPSAASAGSSGATSAASSGSKSTQPSAAQAGASGAQSAAKDASTGKASGSYPYNSDSGRIHVADNNADYRSLFLETSDAKFTAPELVNELYSPKYFGNTFKNEDRLPSTPTKKPAVKAPLIYVGDYTVVEAVTKAQKSNADTGAYYEYNKPDGTKGYVNDKGFLVADPTK